MTYMKRKIIVANWKMNPKTSREAVSLARAVDKSIGSIKKAEVILAPPFLYLDCVGKVIRFAKLCAQDAFWERAGAFTGEISPLQLRSSGVSCVIVGHSERRALGEDDEVINKKLKSSLECGLRVVFCVGEEEKKQEISFPPLVRRELHHGIRKVKKNLLRNLIVAYEPVWAVGTKNADTPKNIYEMSALIRRELHLMFGARIASHIPVLYGGSIDTKNAALFVGEGNVDGLLVGGASLIAKKFINIVKETSRP